MIAVVSTAFDDLRSADVRQRDTAVRYFFLDPETHVLSFPSVCRQMDWSVSAVRRRLKQTLSPWLVPMEGLELESQTI